MSEPDFTVRDEAHLMSEETLAKTTALPLSPGTRLASIHVDHESGTWTEIYVDAPSSRG